MLFINAKVVTDEFKIEELDVRVENGKFTSLAKAGTLEAKKDEEIIDVESHVIAPGMLDNHVHGAMGKDVMDGSFDSLDTISRYLASKGITSFLPTTMTMGPEHLSAVYAIKEKLSGANMLGFHMEGPFINKSKKGAQNEDYIRKATMEEMLSYGDAKIKLITIAPEVEGSLEFIQEAHDKYVISMGHSEATYEDAKKAIEAGAKSVTHCFNAMSPLHHRAPGIIGAAVQAGIYGELICDGLHIHPATVYCNYKMFGPERMILVSDSVRASGLGDGTYEFGGQAMIVKDNVARVEDGSIAGGMSNVWNNMRNCVQWGIPLLDAMRMGSLTPATLIGVDDSKGSIAVGKDADFVITNDKLDVLQVFINGREFI